MTVAAAIPEVTYAADGVSTVFTAPWQFAGDDLSVLRIDPDGSEIDITSGWSVLGGETDDGGTVTMDTPPASGTWLRLRRRTPRNQLHDYQTNDTFPAESHEAALDRLTRITQELDLTDYDTRRRALMVPPGETVTNVPNLENRKNKYLGFDGLGNPTADILTLQLLSGVNAVATIALLAAIENPVDGQLAFVTTFPRAGMFVFWAGNRTAQVTNDPGQGVHVAPTASPTGSTGVWRRTEARHGYLKAGWFGLENGLSDCSAIFQAIDQFRANTMRTSAGAYDSTVKAASYVCYLGFGDFPVNTPAAFHDGNLYSGNSMSIKFVGLGPGMSNVHYAPTTAGAFIRNNRSLDLSFEGMTFVGAAAVDGTGASNWMNASRYTYATQGLYASNVMWTGLWAYGVDLAGDNNNSEHIYNHCSWYSCDLTSWLHSEIATVFDPGQDGSEQFVNYSFLHCKFWGCTGPWVDMASGGHIYVQDCDVSAWGANSAKFTTAKYLFNLGGENHSAGVTQFVIDGLRVEAQNVNSRILYCEWPFGKVTVRSCDASSQSWVAGPLRAAELFKFVLPNGGGPSIHFVDCDLPGKARYEIKTTTGLYDSRVGYDYCTFLNVAHPNDYFVYTYPTTPISYIGALPMIVGTQCRAWDINAVAPGFRQVGDFRLNPLSMGNNRPLQVTTFMTIEKTMPFSAYNGGIKVQFPLGAVFYELRIRAPAGHTGENAIREFVLKDQTGAVIATVSTVGLSAAGFDETLVFDPPFAVSAGHDIISCETDATQDSASGRVELTWA